MFDPEKVERYYDAVDANGERYIASASWIIESLSTRIDDWVRAADYDKLLELYRGLRREMNQAMNDSRAASTVNSIVRRLAP